MSEWRIFKDVTGVIKRRGHEIPAHKRECGGVAYAHGGQLTKG